MFLKLHFFAAWGMASSLSALVSDRACRLQKALA